MTRDDIIRMAREAHLDVYGLGNDREKFVSVVERFVNLVAAAERNRTWTQDHWTEYERSIAAAEREACAEVCDELAADAAKEQDFHALFAAESCADAIRERGQDEMSQVQI
jgi:hypothetical protein